MCKQASKIDDDIMNTGWPVDCVEKAKVIRIYQGDFIDRDD